MAGTIRSQGLLAEGLVISCDSCERDWRARSAFTVYERQALESRPCPHCGAYTLCFHEPDDRGPKPRRRAG